MIITEAVADSLVKMENKNMADPKRGFNYRLYAELIRSWIPDINEDDLIWLCNKAGQLYKKIKVGGCVDNFRASRLDAEGKHSPEYTNAVAQGCCGFADVAKRNPRTDNKFKVGFNYGH